MHFDSVESKYVLVGEIKADEIAIGIEAGAEISSWI
jgi:hypothetical protein